MKGKGKEVLPTPLLQSLGSALLQHKGMGGMGRFPHLAAAGDAEGSADT